MTFSVVCSLSLSAKSETLVYQGLTNTSLGNATMAASGSNVVISNLSSSGQDGVSIALPSGLSALEAHWQALDASNTLPVGAYVQEQSVGTANGIVNGVLGTVKVTKSGASNYFVSANFSPLGVKTYTVQAYLHGVLVAQATGQTGTSLAAMDNWNLSGDFSETCCPFNLTISMDWGSSGTLALVGTTEVMCDQLYITPENVSLGSAPTAFQITASGVPSLTITGENESLVYQGLANTSLGNASVAAACCVSNLSSGGQDGLALVVSNLSSSGQDGVSIALPPGLTALDVESQPLDISNTLPIGAYIQEQMVGTGAGISNGVLGTITVTKEGVTNFSMSADFSPLGASNYIVQAFLNGVLVGQQTNIGGPSIFIIKWLFGPLSIGYETTTGNWGVQLDTFGSGVVAFSGSLNVTCDHLLITPNNGTLGSTPTAMQITASGVPALTIVGENESLSYQGLANTSLGNASVAVSCCVSNLGSGGQDGLALVISNLSSSGQDGVSIALPASLSALDVHWQPLDGSNTLPVGAYTQEQAVGTAHGVSNGVLGTLSVTKIGTTNYLLSANFSPLGATACTVQAYLHGVLVAQVTNQAQTSLAFMPLWPTSGGINWVCCPFIPIPWIDWDVSPTSVTLGAGLTVTCDQLLIVPENVPSGSNGSMSTPTAFQITASQVPALAITGENESLVYQGVTNTSLGNASVAITCCVSNLTSGGQDGLALVITNLGSSGQDGVSITLPANQSALTVEYQPLDVSNTLPVGAYIQEQVVGTANGITNGGCGAVTVTKNGTTNYLLSANFSPLGATTYTVQAYLRGGLVAQATGQNGGTVGEMSTCISEWDIEIGPNPPYWRLTHGWGGSATTFTLIGSTGGSTVACDQVSITPNNVTLGTAPTALNITASGVPEITITSQNASLVYQGLTNTSLGDASVAVVCCVSNLSSGGQDGLALIITNLGSSGQDGVSIALPNYLTALVAHFLPLDVSNTLPVGAYIQEQVVGTANGITNGVIGTVTVTKNGTTNYLLSANFSPLGASTYTMQAYLRGVLVAQATGQNEAPVGEMSTCISEWDIEIGPPPPYWRLTHGWGGSATSLTLIGPTGGSTVTCDQVFIAPNNLTTGTAPTAMDITASAVPALTITGENESLLYAGLTNTSLGDASVAVNCCVSNLSSGGQDGLALVVSNLSSSGQDGVSIALPRANLTALELTGQPLDVSNSLPVGAYLQEQVVGTANGITNGVCGTITVTKSGTTNYSVSADFSPIGATACTIQAYLQGAVVAQATGANGSSLAEVAQMCSSWDIEISCCPFEWHMTHGWGGSATSVTLPGSTALTCDHLLITPQKVTFNSAPTAFQITASMVPSLTMTAVAVSPLAAGVSQNGQSVTLQWFGTGVLQESSDLKTWLDVSGANSPHTVPLGGTNQFFRILQSVPE